MKNFDLDLLDGLKATFGLFLIFGPVLFVYWRNRI